ncbi:LIM domain-containing protein [Mycena floridula]|nr:LIM domain-containing protein [Mycena floridula]
MSKEQEARRVPSPWTNGQNNSPTGSSGSLSIESDAARFLRNNSNSWSPNQGPSSAPATNAARLPERTQLPTRSSTTGTSEPDRNHSFNDAIPHARSEDLNHGLSSSPRPSPAFLQPAGGSRPSTPPGSSKHSQELNRRLSNSSFSSVHSAGSTSSNGARAPTTTSTSTSLAAATCSSCGKAMQGPFVRALGTVFHLNCFKCMDCGDVVASKFFPIEGVDGKQQPLCEKDYFRRLNLICAKCGLALRGSYITACNKKFHVEHFTCSLCSTLFGPQDSYYEHHGDVYCHFHYSTRFATKCAGCSSAILKQFVEINRNMRDECWHPECYMINKFWNVKVVSRRPTSSASLAGEAEDPAYVEEERIETPTTLKDKQVRMEQQVYRIWTVLSAFEESSAACISDMLRQVSNGQYLDAIRMAEKFILHVEVLFATIDDLEYHFYRLQMKGMSHVREARMLCRKTVELFTLLSHTQETGSRRMGMTQELLALVTGLAHYLKILIRIALTGALKLEREQSDQEAMASFLDKLHLLAVQGGNPSARRQIKGQNGEMLAPSQSGNFGTQGVTYGFRSLAPENAGESPFNAVAGPSTKISSSKPPSDLCVKCNLTVEEDCVRLGTYQRWHSHCIQCAQCGKVAAVPVPKEAPTPRSVEDGSAPAPKLSTARRPPANVGLFVYDPETMHETASFGDVPTVILCTDHAHGACRSGFQAVQRLEQYAFLLNVALRRLYLLLKKQGVVPMSPAPTQQVAPPDSDPYRNSADIMRMKSAHLYRNPSATARTPKRSTIVESPAGRSVAPSDVLHSQKSQDGHSQPQQVVNRSPPQQHQAFGSANRPHLGQLPDIDPQQVMRPAYARNNTEVMIVDESAPNSPAIERPMTVVDSSITLADIPQIMEAAQAREQHRSLPRENSIPYIAELSALELAIVKHSALLVLTRSPLRDQMDFDELLELVEVKKSGFWNKLFKGDKKNIKKKGVFGVPLELLVEREGSDSVLGASPATLRVPSFIDDVISAMRQMDMSVEGIFRKNGNIRRLRELTDSIDRDPASVDLTQDNAVQLAALLKKFLRDLPDPLMTFKLHRLLLASQSQVVPEPEDRKRLLHMLAIIMPKAHRDSMEVLFVFLKWVASFAHLDEETGSKMDMANLATVICPSILYSRARDGMENFNAGIRVITALLENQDEFFAVPAEFLPILHDQEYFANSMELPAKDFLKKCDTYHKVKATNGRPPPGSPFNLPNGSTPRFPASPLIDRPPMGGPSPSERTIRQNSGGNSMSPPQSFALPGSPLPAPRDEWPGPAPSRSSSSSRPSSVVQSRPSTDQSAFAPNPNGYPVRQRT